MHWIPNASPPECARTTLVSKLSMLQSPGHRSRRTAATAHGMATLHGQHVLHSMQPQRTVRECSIQQAAWRRAHTMQPKRRRRCLTRAGAGCGSRGLTPADNSCMRRGEGYCYPPVPSGTTACMRHPPEAGGAPAVRVLLLTAGSVPQFFRAGACIWEGDDSCQGWRARVTRSPPFHHRCVMPSCPPPAGPGSHCQQWISCLGHSWHSIPPGCLCRPDAHGTQK